MCLILGHIGKDAETKSTSGGKMVTNFSVATERSWKDPSGEWKKETTWHDVVAWGLRDEIASALVKGALVDVEGRMNKRSYDNKEGRKIYVHEIIADRVNFLRLANQSGPPTRSEDEKPW